MAVCRRGTQGSAQWALRLGLLLTAGNRRTAEIAHTDQADAPHVGRAMRKTKTAKQPLSTRRKVVDDIPASPVPTEPAPNQIAEMKDRHQQFMARVVVLCNVPRHYPA